MHGTSGVIHCDLILPLSRQGCNARENAAGLCDDRISGQARQTGPHAHALTAMNVTHSRPNGTGICLRREPGSVSAKASPTPGRPSLEGRKPAPAHAARHSVDHILPKRKSAVLLGCLFTLLQRQKPRDSCRRRFTAKTSKRSKVAETAATTHADQAKFSIDFSRMYAQQQSVHLRESLGVTRLNTSRQAHGHKLEVNRCASTFAWPLDRI